MQILVRKAYLWQILRVCLTHTALSNFSQFLWVLNESTHRTNCLINVIYQKKSLLSNFHLVSRLKTRQENNILSCHVKKIASCKSNKDQCRHSLLALQDLIKGSHKNLTPSLILTLDHWIIAAKETLLKITIFRI